MPWSVMNGTKADCDWYSKWSKQDLQANFAFMRAFSKELKDSTELANNVSAQLYTPRAAAGLLYHVLRHLLVVVGSIKNGSGSR